MRELDQSETIEPVFLLNAFGLQRAHVQEETTPKHGSLCSKND